MNAIEIKGLSKSFGKKLAVNELNMTVPVGAIYGFIGENGSGKSTTEKLLCGLLVPDNGSIKLFGKDYQNEEVRSKVSCLIETPSCFPNMSVWNNLILHATSLNLKNPDDEVRKVLKLVRMEGSASNKFKNCSLGMRQRIGIAMCLLGNPYLLVLDEPINGLDADGMRIMREVLTDITKLGCTVLISSHILGELEKIATHYGIIRKGRMIKEMTSEELDKECPTYIAIKTKNMSEAKNVLLSKYSKVCEDDKDNIRIYDANCSEDVVSLLCKKDILISEITTNKISLEEYHININKEEK